MGILIAGVGLWMAAHFLKRLAPDARAGMNGKIGAGPARGVMTVLVIASVVLMVVGYRSADLTPLYSPIPGMGHLNNLLMLVAVAMMGMGNSKGRARTFFRHPMLMGIIVWGTAHLLVNGDLASLVLFGGMIIWALISMQLINKAEGPVARPEPGPIAGDIKLVVITLVIFSVIAGVHTWLGYSPFLGTYG